MSELSSAMAFRSSRHPIVVSSVKSTSTSRDHPEHPCIHSLVMPCRDKFNAKIQDVSVTLCLSLSLSRILVAVSCRSMTTTACTCNTMSNVYSGSMRRNRILLRGPKRIRTQSIRLLRRAHTCLQNATKTYCEKVRQSSTSPCVVAGQ